MSSAHAHLALDRSSLTEEARRVFEESGERWTDTRAAVFDALASSGKPSSAYDVAAAVSAAQTRRMPANSVYRILDLFAAHDVIKRIESRKAYVVNEHPGCRHDCIFLLCDRCGAIAHVDDDPTVARVRRAAAVGGFEPLRPVIEVRGRCASCAAKGDGS